MVERFDYRSRLNALLEEKKITEAHYRHFSERGVEVIDPKEHLGLHTLARYLPKIVIGASPEYRRKMKVPYQATSFLAAAANEKADAYVFKIPGQKGGGVESLTGGERKPGDNVYASTHRILIGYDANMVSADNFMANKEQIWNWEFFGNHFKKVDKSLYEDLLELARIRKIPASPYHVVIVRKSSTVEKNNIIGEYKKNNIAALRENGARVIFMTSDSAYEKLSPEIPKSKGSIEYVKTGEPFDILAGLKKLRSEYNMEVLLNDGGRQMSNGVRDAGLLGEERITLEPYPGSDMIPENLHEDDPSSVLGRKGAGLDGSELTGAIRIYSHPIGDERANVYLYPLDERKIF